MLGEKANRWLLICLKLDCIFSFGLFLFFFFFFLLEEQVRQVVCVCLECGRRHKRDLSASSVRECEMNIM